MRLLLLALSVQMCGCYTLHDTVNDTLTGCRDHLDARAAWMAHGRDLAACEEHPHHFGVGYREGYRAIAAGGNGCPPTLPPRKYWCVCYQSDAGKTKTVAWYNGYAAGTAAAEQDGVRERNRLVTASEIYRHNCPECQTEIVIDKETADGLNPTPIDSVPPVDGDAPYDSEAPNFFSPTPEDQFRPDVPPVTSPFSVEGPELEAAPETQTESIAPVRLGQTTVPPVDSTLPLPPRPQARELKSFAQIGGKAAGSKSRPWQATAPKDVFQTAQPLRITDRYAYVTISDQKAGVVRIPQLGESSTKELNEQLFSSDDPWPLAFAGGIGE